MSRQFFILLLLVLLAGCATVRRSPVALSADEVAKIKTIEIVVIASRDPITIQRQYHNSSSTIALQNVGGVLGSIAAGAIASSENKGYANIAEQVKAQTQSLRSQVNDIDYRETFINRLQATLKLDGPIHVSKITGRDDDFSFLRSGYYDYAKRSDADAVLFIYTNNAFYGDAEMDLTQHASTWISTKERPVVFDDNTYFYAPQPPYSTVSEKIEWWKQENRYRSAVLHSMSAISLALNQAVFSRSDFLSQKEIDLQLEKLRDRSRTKTFKMPEFKKQRQCKSIPSAETFDARNYLVQQHWEGNGFGVTLVCPH